MIKKHRLLLFVFISTAQMAFAQNNTDQDDGFQIDAYAGVIRNSFPTTFKGRYDNYQFDPVFSPSIGINFLYTIPANVKYLKFGLSIGYNGYSAKISQTGTNVYSSGDINYNTNYSEKITLSNTLLSTNIYGMFVVNPKSKTQVYAKLGLSINFGLAPRKGLESENSSVSDGTSGNSPIHASGQSVDKLANMKQVFLALQTGAGVAIGKSKIEICYWPSANIADADLPRYSTMQTDFKLSSIGIFYYYRFTK